MDSIFRSFVFVSFNFSLKFGFFLVQFWVCKASRSRNGVMLHMHKHRHIPSTYEVTLFICNALGHQMYCANSFVCVCVFTQPMPSIAGIGTFIHDCESYRIPTTKTTAAAAVHKQKNVFFSLSAGIRFLVQRTNQNYPKRDNAFIQNGSRVCHTHTHIRSHCPLFLPRNGSNISERLRALIHPHLPAAVPNTHRHTLTHCGWLNRKTKSHLHSLKRPFSQRKHFCCCYLLLSEPSQLLCLPNAVLRIRTLYNSTRTVCCVLKQAQNENISLCIDRIYISHYKICTDDITHTDTCIMPKSMHTQ